MHDKIIKIFTGLFALTLLIVFNSFPSTGNLFSSIGNNFISQAQQINSTENGNLSIGSNHTGTIIDTSYDKRNGKYQCYFYSN